MRLLIAFSLIGCFLLAAGLRVSASNHPGLFTAASHAAKASHHSINSISDSAAFTQDADLPGQNEPVLLEEEDDDEENCRKTRPLTAPQAGYCCETIFTTAYYYTKTVFTGGPARHIPNGKFLSIRVLRI
ncbi:MAG TPA: hypothetical protein VL307_14885 [Chitinophagaceae bacterium]|nr:hypothetical protein [Chitinophagaceae bacterium]